MSKRHRSVPGPFLDSRSALDSSGTSDEGGNGPSHPIEPTAAEPVVVASDRIALVVWLMGAFTMTVMLLKDLIVSLVRSGLQNG